MIKIDVLNNNSIVTLSSESKIPIKSSQGLMFYSPNELLCVTVGACVGKHLVRYCSQNKIDVRIFEQLKVDMDNDNIYVYVQHPKDMETDEIKHLILNCDIAKRLKIDIEVVLFPNDNDEDEVIKTNTPTPCCGG